MPPTSMAWLGGSVEEAIQGLAAGPRGENEREKEHLSPAASAAPWQREGPRLPYAHRPERSGSPSSGSLRVARPGKLQRPAGAAPLRWLLAAAIATALVLLGAIYYRKLVQALQDGGWGGAPLEQAAGSAVALEQSSDAEATPPDNIFNGSFGGYGHYKVGPLQVNLRRKDMDLVFLAQHWTPSKRHREVVLECPGRAECPAFSSCGGNFSAVQACANGDLTSGPAHYLPLPRNQPPKSEDTAPYQDQFISLTWVFENVYVDEAGHVFNETHVFDRNGCRSTADFNFYANATKVWYFRDMVSVAHWNGGNFWHAVTEVLPLFVATEKVRAHLPGIPIAHRACQLAMVDLAVLVGVPVESVNWYLLLPREIFHVQRLIMPNHQTCGHPSRNVFSHIRAKYFKPGAPRSPLRSLRPNSHLLPFFGPRAPDWYIVLVKRYGSRQLVETDAVEAGLVRIFGARRVRIFERGLPPLEAMAFFHKVRFLVGVHGAGLTNLVFQPQGSAVLEVRPIKEWNTCYHHLSDACELDYYLLRSTGSHNSATSVNVTELLDLVKHSIAPGIRSRSFGST